MIDDIEYIGFKKADEIAMKMGFAIDDKRRIYAGVKFVLNASTEDGHTFLYFNELVSKACDMLTVNEYIVKIKKKGNCLCDINDFVLNLYIFKHLSVYGCSGRII